MDMEGAQTAFYIAATVAMVLVSLLVVAVLIQVILIGRKIRKLVKSFESQVRKAYVARLAAKVWLLELVGGLLGISQTGGDGYGG